MATQYIHEFASLADFNASAPKRPSAFALGSVSSVLYNGKDGSTTPAVQNFQINTQDLSKTIRLNSQTDSTTASGDLIGFQSKPRTGVAGTQNVIGCQISAQVSNGIALSSSGSVIGGHFDVYLRGTAAGTIAGDVRGLQIELTTDDAGTRDITGYVTALRIRKVFSAGTVTGKQSAIRIEKPEAQTGSESYDCVFQFTDSIADVWAATGDKTGTPAGYIAVMFDSTKKYIQTYT